MESWSDLELKRQLAAHVEEEAMESAEGSQADEMTSLAVLQGEIRASIARRAANGEVGGGEVESELAGKEGEGEGDAAETTAPPESQQAQDHRRPRPASSSTRPPRGSSQGPNVENVMPLRQVPPRSMLTMPGPSRI